MKRPFLIKKRGKCYYYRLASEVTFHTTGKTSKAKAEQWVLNLLDGKRENSSKKIAQTFRGYAKDFFIWDTCKWIKRQEARGKAVSLPMAKMRRGQLQNYLLPQFGNKRLADINPVEIENWLLDLPLANNTKNHIIGTLGIILKEAERENIIQYSPVTKVDSLAKNYKRRDIFSIDELNKLFPGDLINLIKIWRTEEWAVLFLIAATTGLRRGEVCAVEWRQIVWAKNGILIDQAVKADGKIGKTKSGQHRAVLISDKVKEILSHWYSVTPFNKSSDLVFYGADARTPISAATVSKQLKPALVKAGIVRGNRNLVVHSFRHTYNTYARKILPGKLLRQLVGHQSEGMTNRYDQASANDKLDAIADSKKLIEQLWSPTSD